MDTNNIGQFMYAMPEVAREELAAKQINAVAVGNGISRLEISGQDRGIAFRFENVPMYNPTKSEETGIEWFDQEEVCFRYIDRKNIIPMPVKNCPAEFLKFNRAGDLIGGRYAEAYKAWKSGEKAPGTSLRRWDVLNSAEIASLEGDAIYTIEQFAEYPESRLIGRYPTQFIEAHKRAQQWVAGRDLRDRALEQTGRLAELEKEKADLAERLAKLEALLEEKTEPKKNKLVEGRK